MKRDWRFHFLGETYGRQKDALTDNNQTTHTHTHTPSVTEIWHLAAIVFYKQSKSNSWTGVRRQTVLVCHPNVSCWNAICKCLRSGR